MKTLKVGVVGTGRIGKLHVNNLMSRVKNATVVAVTDVVYDSAQALAKQWNIPKVYKDYKELVADPEIDAVLVCSSTDTHSIIAYEAVMAGKHVFCEKPIDYDLGRIQKVIDAVEQKGVKFQVGFNRRFDRNFKKVRDSVQSGVIGAPHIVMVTSRDPEPPPVSYVKVSGGIFLDMMIHDFDMVRYLSGSEVTEVFANGAVLVDPGIGEAGDVDTAIVTLKFKNGAIGVINNSRQAVYGYDQRVEVFGSKGCITADNETPNLTTLSTAEGVTKEKPLFFFLERYNDAFIAELDGFVEAVLEDKPTLVNATDGLKPVLIAMAAKKSLETGLPVKL
ncbi:MAG: inositol 2-dehydrogenase [Christensenellaceae bacterium]|jgi:myo-inositol 2-dehydrogenase/D-chiro-inositol 1-dehydrogenase|nr:inositol 2-dehydrogenase [Christensenellaceae bacterium]